MKILPAKNLNNNNQNSFQTSETVNILSADISKMGEVSGGTFSGIPESPSVAAVSGVSSINATTTFVDDKDTVQRDESRVAHVSDSWLSLNDTQQTEQSIIDFLAKPIVLFSNSFSVSDTFSFLQSTSMPLAAFTSAQGSLWTNKLLGYFGIRMDMRIRIVVNANRFQQGRYIVGWMPLGGNLPTTSDFKSSLTNNMHMATLVQRTTVPHVEIDIATQTSAELLIPFASVHNFYPLNAIAAGSRVGALGYLNVYPYSPLVAPTGSTVASYTVYVSFENVRLFGAASAQSGLQDREVSNKMNGPISGVAKSFARGFREFANIPLLSSYASGAAWIADRIARTASIFGFSKPTQGDSISKMAILNNPAHSCVDGDSDVRPLSYHSKPATVPVKGMSGTDFDEMDFSYIVRKYSFFDSFSWTTSSTGALRGLQTTPNQFVTAGGAYSFPPVSFVSQFFTYWRGSLKFRFKFVKTEFHSGRLQFSFYPTDEIAALTDGPQYVNRVIVDIRDHVELELVIPYISRSPWTHRGNYTGLLEIEVVDALVAPSSVSNSITILVEIAGGDDVEFAIPSGFSMQPTLFTPQSGLDDNKIITMNIGNSIVTGNSVASSAFCMGDKVSSFRALLKRYTPILPTNRNAGNTARLVTSVISVTPDFIPIKDTTPTSTGYLQCDIVGVVAMCYTFWGGSVRIKDIFAPGLFSNPNSITTSNCASANFVPRASGTVSTLVVGTAAGTVNVDENNHQVYQQIFNNNTVSLEIPQYTQNLKRNIADCWGSNPDVGATYKNYQVGGGTLGNVLISLPGGLTSVTPPAGYDVHNLFRSLGDDGDFSLFISIPPLVFFTNQSNPTIY